MYKQTIKSGREVLTYPPTYLNSSGLKAQPYVSGFSELGKPIPCNQGYGIQIYKTVRQNWNAGIRESFRPDFKDNSINSEVYRFYMALIAYYASSRPVIPPEQLFEIILKEADGITYLKKVRTYSMIRSMDCYPQVVDPEDEFYYQEAKKFYLVDIGDYFNVRYWLFFDQPDPEDWKACNIPLDYDHTLLKQFKETLTDILPDMLVEPIQEEEILLEVTGSSSLCPDGKTTRPHWYNKQKSNYFSSRPLRGKGSYVQKCPGDTRFCFVLPVEQSNSVKLIEKQVAQIAREVPWSCYTNDHEDFYNTYNKFKGRNSHFYCRDIKKDGLTKNRALIMATLDVLEEKYPGLPAWKYKNIFSSFYLSVNGVWMNPPRGVGLGMSAAITTIIQSCIVKMVIDIQSEKYMLGTIDAIIYHDDISIGSTNEDTLEDFKDIDYEICTRLGIYVSKNKCFTGTNFVLCENYSDEVFNTKESYQRTLLQQIFCCENVTHAKYTFLSNYRYVEPEYWSEYLDKVITWFGYEFYKEEANAPSLLGGWVPQYYQKVDISLDYMDRMPYKSEFAASLSNKLHKIHFINRERSKKPYNPPVKQLFPLATNFGRPGLFYTDMTEWEVGSHLSRMDKEGRTSYYWAKQYDLRQKDYKRFFQGDWMHLEDWYSELRSIHCTLDIIPPKELRSEFDASIYPEVEELYRPANPRMQYLKALNPGAFSKKLIPWNIPPDITVDPRMNLSAFERNQVKLTIHLFDRWTADLGELQLVKPPLRAINSDEWFNPNGVNGFFLSKYNRDVLCKFRPRPDMQRLPDDLFYKINNPNHLNLVPYLTQRLGFERAMKVPLTYFKFELDKFLQKGRLIKIKQIKKAVELQALELAGEAGSEDTDRYSEVDSFEWDEQSLNDWDFFTWRTSKKNYLNWRNHFFRLIDDKVTALEVLAAGYLNQFDDFNKRDYALMDPIELHLYKESGGIVDDDLVPILDRPLDVDPERDKEGDVFRASDTDASGSDVGLMVGW